MSDFVLPAPKIIFNKTGFKNVLASSLSYIPQVIRVLPKPPYFVQKVVIEQILNKTLKEQIEMGDFDFLLGHCLHLCIKDLKLDLYLSYKQDKLILVEPTTKADVHFIGNSKELVLIASRIEDPDTFFFQRKLIIEGDTELGLHIKNSIDAVDYDTWPKWLNSLLKSMADLIGIQSQKQT